MPSCPECENDLDVNWTKSKKGMWSPARSAAPSTRWSA